MVEAGIMRTPTADEKEDYKELGEQSVREIFLKELADVEMKFIKEHKPFDSQCAKLDFADKLENIEKESERIYGYVRVGDIRNLKFGDLEKYGDIGRFDKVGDDEDIEVQVITVGGKNVRKNVVSGHTVHWKCKQRGHGCSVAMTMDEYEERFGKGKKEVKEEK